MIGRNVARRMSVLARPPAALRRVALTDDAPPRRLYSTERSARPRPRHVGAIQNTPHLKRKLGQHLLVNEKILSQIVDAAEIPAILSAKQVAIDAAPAPTGDDGEELERALAAVRILEIGPGTGNLTSALLNIAPSVSVHVVEYDARMVERLKERFVDELASERLRIENIDFEEFAFAKQLEPIKAHKRVSIRNRAKARQRATAAAAAATENERRHFDACVANIPYQLSSIIISRLTNYMYRFPDRMQCAVLLVQEEFAQRLLAKPGTQNYSRLSVNTALVADVTSVVPVGRHHFLPPPKVDSRVIMLTPKPRERDDSDCALQVLPDDADEQKFFQRFDTLLRIAFTRKNKTLRAALLSSTAKSLMEKETQEALSKDELTARVEAALEATDLATKRAVQLPVHDFKRLMDELSSRGIVFRVSETRHFRD